MALSRMVQSEGKMPMAAQEELSPDDVSEMGSEGGEDLDNEIAFGLMANTLLQKEGQQGLAEAMNQGNPVPIVASMVAALVVELAKKFEGSDMQIDQGVWLSPNGAVERTIDFIDEVAGPIEEEVKTAIFSDVVDQIKLFKNKGTPGSAANAQAPQGVPMPQGVAQMGQMAPPMPMQSQGGMV